MLTEFDPNDYLNAFGFEREKADKISKAIFKSAYWKDYMIGLLDSKKFKEKVIFENPELKNEIEFVLNKENTYKMLPPLKEGIEFLLSLKHKGYEIFIMSNMVKDSLKYFKNNFNEVTKVLSGAIYSCDAHLRKPDEEIYNLLLNKFNLKANETLFLDDSERNIKKACELGIIGVHCQPVFKRGEFERINRLLEDYNQKEK